MSVAGHLMTTSVRDSGGAVAPVQDPIRCVWSVSMRVACELCRELISMDWAVLIAVLIPCAPAANAAAQ